MRFSVRHLLILTFVASVSVLLIRNYLEPTPIRIELTNKSNFDLDNLLLKFAGQEIQDIHIQSIANGETQVFQMNVWHDTHVSVIKPSRYHGAGYARPICPRRLRLLVTELKYELSINKNNIKNLK